MRVDSRAMRVGPPSCRAQQHAKRLAGIHADKCIEVAFIIPTAGFNEPERLFAIEDRQLGQPVRLPNRLFIFRHRFLGIRY